MAKDAASAYNREGMNPAILAAGASAGVSNRLCLTGTAVPAAMGPVTGQKYQSNPAEWTTGPARPRVPTVPTKGLPA